MRRRLDPESVDQLCGELVAGIPTSASRKGVLLIGLKRKVVNILNETLEAVAVSVSECELRWDPAYLSRCLARGDYEGVVAWCRLHHADLIRQQKVSLELEECQPHNERRI